MAAGDLGKRWGLIMGLRGLLMLLAGLYAVIWPGSALFVLVTVGAALLVVDGVLGLWALTFGGAKTGNFWFDVARNVLAVIVGVIILISPILSAIFTTLFLIYIAGIQAVIVGVMELVMVFRARQLFAHIWPVMLSGILYILFGLMLLFAPLMSALALVTVAGIFAVIFAIGLFGLAWRLHKEGM